MKRMCVLIVAAVMLIATQSAAATRYTVTDLGIGFVPRAVNRHGMVVGSVSGNFAVWDGTQLIVGPTGIAHDVNDAGQVVGRLTGLPTDHPLHRAVLWEDGNFFDLPVPEGTTYSEGVSIDNAGNVLMQAANPQRHDYALWYNNQLIVLAQPPAGHFFFNGSGRALNNHGGALLTYSQDLPNNNQRHAAVADIYGTWAVIGHIGDGVSIATGLNDAWQVSGTMTTTGPQRAFRAQVGGPLTLLALPASFEQSEGMGIDEDGTIVGHVMPRFQTTLMFQRAVRWTPAGTPIDLNSEIDPASGWVLHRVADIQGGLIVGVGIFHGRFSGFLLTP